MNNSITPISQSPSVPATLLEMRADSRRFPRVKSVTREQAYVEMSKIVSQAFLYKGQEVEPSKIQFIAVTLVDELLEDRVYGAANISFAEIQVVVKRAVLGGTEMFGISVASLYKVIMDFVKGEGHDNDKQICKMKRESEEKKLKDSIIAPMLSAYSGKFIKEHKI